MWLLLRIISTKQKLFWGHNRIAHLCSCFIVFCMYCMANGFISLLQLLLFDLHDLCPLWADVSFLFLWFLDMFIMCLFLKHKHSFSFKTVNTLSSSRLLWDHGSRSVVEFSCSLHWKTPLFPVKINMNDSGRNIQGRGNVSTVCSHNIHFPSNKTKWHLLSPWTYYFWKYNVNL